MEDAERLEDHLEEYEKQYGDKNISSDDYTAPSELEATHYCETEAENVRLVSVGGVLRCPLCGMNPPIQNILKEQNG